MKFGRSSTYMENIKKSPALMGILNAVGCAALLFAIEFIMSLVKNKSFGDQITSPLVLVVLIVGPVATGITTYRKTKDKLEGKEKK